MLHASCSSVHGGRLSSGDMAVRGWACQDDCRVRGYVGLWIVEGELHAAVYSAAAWLRAVFVGGEWGILTVFCCFFSSLPTAHKTVFILAYSV